MELLASVALVQFWSGGATCIATLPWIAQLALSACIELVSSSARVTSVKSQQGHSVSCRLSIRTHRSDPQVYLGPIKIWDNKTPKTYFPHPRLATQKCFLGTWCPPHVSFHWKCMGRKAHQNKNQPRWMAGVYTYIKLQLSKSLDLVLRSNHHFFHLHQITT